MADVRNGGIDLAVERVQALVGGLARRVGGIGIRQLQEAVGGFGGGEENPRAHPGQQRRAKPGGFGDLGGDDWNAGNICFELQPQFGFRAAANGAQYVNLRAARAQ